MTLRTPGEREETMVEDSTPREQKGTPRQTKESERGRGSPQRDKREEREGETEIQNVFDGLDFTAVDVDAVTHGLEGKEGNTHRQNDLIDEGVGAEHLVAGGGKEVVYVKLDACKIVEGVQEEIGIFIIAKHQKRPIPCVCFPDLDMWLGSMAMAFLSLASNR